jgi:hypothetical protein
MNTTNQTKTVASSIGITKTVSYSATLPPAVLHFDSMPATACVTINEGVQISHRSRASLYRDHDAGLLPFAKLGKSTRIRVGDLRKYLNGGAAK